MPTFMLCMLLACESMCVSKEVCIRLCESGFLSPGLRSWERLQPVIKSLFEIPD